MVSIIKKYFTGPTRRKKMGVFAIFVLFSFFMWFLIKLSKNYTYKISFDVDYKNIPEEKILLSKPVKTLDVIVNATGFKIFNYNLFKKNLDIDLSGYDDPGRGFYILEDDLEEEIGNQYSDLTLRRVLADTVHIQFGINKQKYVKVVPKLTLNFSSDYELYDEIKVTPDSIWILGPENIVDTIAKLNTVEYKADNISNNLDATLDIDIPLPLSLEEISYETKKVEITAKVEKFSEKMIEVPVTVKKVPEKLSVRTFPPAVNVLVKTALKDLKNISVEDFMVSCDFNEEAEGKLKLKLEKSPDIQGEIKLQTNEVEFLVKKQ
ncbi:hypothetical protein [Abyssalbus ytuae]|uniref:YbbR-like domain-containing protein n=1 Tax=Abyssalbus ytuae TaxID=2926907 RepID=A0A9E6ZRU5_9FLAO|nr:hypothetical protein [Abyssalbus ytuae]UOB17673.1 hypothetical protein MQE35_18270 [Abyssalbus ytuae]